MWKRQQAFHHLGSFHKQKSKPNMKFHTCWIILVNFATVCITITPNHLRKPRGGLPPCQKLQGNFHLQTFGRFPHSQADFFTEFFPSSCAGSKADSNIMHSSPSRPICQVFCVFLCRFFSVQNWLLLAL